MKTKTLIWILGVWLFSLAVLMLTGCKKKGGTSSPPEEKALTSFLNSYEERENAGTLRINPPTILDDISAEYTYHTNLMRFVGHTNTSFPQLQVGIACQQACCPLSRATKKPLAGTRGLSFPLEERTMANDSSPERKVGFPTNRDANIIVI